MHFPAGASRAACRIVVRVYGLIMQIDQRGGTPGWSCKRPR